MARFVTFITLSNLTIILETAMNFDHAQIEAFNFSNEAQAESPAIVELGELQLALVGGGTGDVVAP